MTADGHIQMELFDRDKTEVEELEQTIVSLLRRFGPYGIQRCTMLLDRQLRPATTARDDRIGRENAKGAVRACTKA